MSRGTHRPFIDSDTPALVALINSAYRGESSKRGWTTEADLIGGQRIDAERVQELARIPANQILVWPSLEENRGPGLNACVLLENRQSRGYLGLLTVSPQLQNGGWGRKVLEVAEDWVRTKWNLKVMEMTVISVRQELIDWYRRRGYQVTDERRPYPMNDPRSGLPQVAHIEFIVMQKNL